MFVETRTWWRWQQRFNKYCKYIMQQCSLASVTTKQAGNCNLTKISTKNSKRNIRWRPRAICYPILQEKWAGLQDKLLPSGNAAWQWQQASRQLQANGNINKEGKDTYRNIKNKIDLPSMYSRINGWPLRQVTVIKNTGKKMKKNICATKGKRQGDGFKPIVEIVRHNKQIKNQCPWSVLESVLCSRYPHSRLNMSICWMMSSSLSLECCSTRYIGKCTSSQLNCLYTTHALHVVVSQNHLFCTQGCLSSRRHWFCYGQS